jgi:hypothetical protein
MKVKLQAWQLWDAVEFGDAEFHEDRLALDAILASVPSEMVASLADKPTTKDAWDSITATHVGLNRARMVTVQKLHPEWECLTFWPKEDVDDFALHLSSLVQQLVRHDDSDIDEQKAVEKYLRVVPKKYTQIALSMETLLDLSTLCIERWWTTVRKWRLPTSSPSTASCSSPRSSGSLARRRKRSRRAHLRPRIVVDNYARRGVTTTPMAGVVQKGEVVVAGNVRWPMTTPASTVVVTASGPRIAASPSVGEQPTWPKLKRKRSLHYSWPTPA